MASFSDGTSTWVVEFDGLVLAEIKTKAGVDIVQDGLFQIEQREDVLTNALLVLCREQIDSAKLTDKQFAKRIIGEVAAKAVEAVGGAARDFFRPSRWSEIQSRSESRREHEEMYQSLRPMLAMLERPEIPQSFRQAVMDAIAAKIEAASSSQPLPVNPSVSGPDATPQNAASDTPDSSESVRAA